VYITCLTLILTLRCQTSSAQETSQTIGKPIDFHCLSREEQDRISICIDENTSCHKSLKRAEEVQALNWTGYLLALGSGMLAGLIVEAQLKHE
jgi:hypothetical protein